MSIYSSIDKVFDSIAKSAKILPAYHDEAAFLYRRMGGEQSLETNVLRRISSTLPAKAKIADLACGDGRMIWALAANKEYCISAIDNSADMLSTLADTARERGYRDIEIIQKDILSWQPNANSYDFIMIGAGSIRLFSRTQRESLYHTIRNALKTHGIFYVDTSVPFDAPPSRLVALEPYDKGDQTYIPFFFDHRTKETCEAKREIGFVLTNVEDVEPWKVYTSSVYDVSFEELEKEILDSELEIKASKKFPIQNYGSLGKEQFSYVIAQKRG